jgi:hypothetical protein
MTFRQVRALSGRMGRSAPWCEPCSRFRLGEVRHDVLPGQRKDRGDITAALSRWGRDRVVRCRCLAIASQSRQIRPERAWDEVALFRDRCGWQPSDQGSTGGLVFCVGRLLVWPALATSLFSVWPAVNICVDPKRHFCCGRSLPASPAGMTTISDPDRKNLDLNISLRDMLVRDAAFCYVAD